MGVAAQPPAVTAREPSEPSGPTGPTKPTEPTPVRTVATIGLLTCALPLNLAITSVALLRRRAQPRSTPVASDPKTILISGGKMTKALHLARAFHRAGHRVILVEAEKYRLTGHRFSTAVDRFYTVPSSGDPRYASALVEIVLRESVDVYVPVCSPASALYDAEAKAELSEYCEVLHPDPDTLTKLDDKFAFSIAAQELDLPVPDAHRISDPEQVLGFDFDGHDPPYILKSIAYDPIRRLDLTRVPQPDPRQDRAFVTALPVSEDNPWIMQSFVAGQEYCTHSTVRDGRVQLHCCCESSASQLNYEMVEVPEIEAWVKRFVGALKVTGQVSFDFIRAGDGRIYAIECNPRTHSAITMFYDHPDVADAYLNADVETVTPLAASRPTYWLYHEVWRLLRHRGRRRETVRRIARGKEAIFAWDDPLPFLLVHHLQIPALLFGNLRRGGAWRKIDFNIGKLVEPGGD
jgi:predicted ATP-grasp superfamily ATP-dependent carboligase